MADRDERIRRLRLLGPEQIRILRLRCQGKLYKEIAAEVSVVAATVKYHLAQIVRKLNLEHLAEIPRLLELSQYGELLDELERYDEARDQGISIQPESPTVDGAIVIKRDLPLEDEDEEQVERDDLALWTYRHNSSASRPRSLPPGGRRPWIQPAVPIPASRGPIPVMPLLAAAGLGAVLVGALVLLGPWAHREPMPTPAVVLQAAPTNSAPTPVPPTLTVAPTSPAAPTPLPTADQAWEKVAGDLDAVWGKDWVRTIALIDGYLSQFADYGPARQKLYAALVTYGKQLLSLGKTNEGIALLVRARAVDPHGDAALAALLALTPTAVPPTTTPIPPPPTQVPAPIVQPAPAPPPPPDPVLRPSTPVNHADWDRQRRAGIVTWEARSENTDGFRIYRRTYATLEQEAVLATVPANSRSYLDTKTSPGRSYIYHVCAFNAVYETCSMSDTAFVGEWSPVR